MYPPGSEIRVVPGATADRWEGAARPGPLRRRAHRGRQAVSPGRARRRLLRPEGHPAGDAGAADGARSGLAARDRGRADGARARRPRAQQPERLPRPGAPRRGAGAERARSGRRTRPSRRASAAPPRSRRDAAARSRPSRLWRSSILPSPSRRRSQPVETVGRRHRRRAGRPGRRHPADRQHRARRRTCDAVHRPTPPDCGPLPAWAGCHPERLAHIQRVAAAGVASGPSGWRVPGLGAESLASRGLAARRAARRRRRRSSTAGRPDAPGRGSLRHGPASAARAEAEGEIDRGVLDAVRYHSVGLAEWDMVGRMLYCADYLEPGREFDRERRAELAERLPGRSGRRAARSRPRPAAAPRRDGMAAFPTHGPFLEQPRRAAPARADRAGVVALAALAAVAAAAASASRWPAMPTRSRRPASGSGWRC